MLRGESDKQKISALVDGELPDHEAEAIITTLRHPVAHADWELYHHIGDVLRTEAMAHPLSKDFSDHLAARLADEPTLLAPAAWRGKQWHVWSLTAMAVAAALTGIMIAPQFLNETPNDNAGPAIAVAELSRDALQAQTDPASAGDRAAVLSDYLRIHHSSYDTPLGAARLARPVDLHRDTSQ